MDFYFNSSIPQYDLLQKCLVKSSLQLPVKVRAAVVSGGQIFRKNPDSIWLPTFFSHQSLAPGKSSILKIRKPVSTFKTREDEIYGIKTLAGKGSALHFFYTIVLKFFPELRVSGIFPKPGYSNTGGLSFGLHDLRYSKGFSESPIRYLDFPTGFSASWSVDWLKVPKRMEIKANRSIRKSLYFSAVLPIVRPWALNKKIQ